MKILEMKNICKSFSGVPVLKNVNLTVNAGEVHALLGENGAGKSTLMNILTGIHSKDKGTVTFDGKQYDHMTIRESEKAGIAFVHQELNLFNDLMVYENIFLNNEYQKGFGRLDKKRMIREANELFEKLGVSIDAEEKVEHLKTSEKQLLEIAKALFFHAKLLILDEPTTSLNNEEIDHLFEIINRLKQQGTAFIFISHKMPEIFALADRYTVLCNGEYVNSGEMKDTTACNCADGGREIFRRGCLLSEKEWRCYFKTLRFLRCWFFSCRSGGQKRTDHRNYRTSGFRKRRGAAGNVRGASRKPWQHGSSRKKGSA